MSRFTHLSRPGPTFGRIARRTSALIAAPILVLGAVAAGTSPAFAQQPAPAAPLVSAPAATPLATQDDLARPVGDAQLVPVQITGPDADRFSLVILGDGYTAAELPKFREQVEEHMNVLWSIEPYKSYRNYFNVYTVELVSAESGVDCDRELTSPKRDTLLDMSFWGGCNPASVERLLTVNNSKAKQYAALAPKVDQILAIGNSDTYGGAGGQYATASGGNALSALITPHEIGHSLGGLQDEYDYYTRGITTGDYTGGEPNSKHHTLLTEDQMREQQVKWWRWLGEESESGGKIGVYEGGQYYSTGIFRPSRHSQMKTLGYHYDQVSREIMTERISSKTSLVPGATKQGEVAPNEVLWVDTAQPVNHDLDVTWAVGGTEITAANGARTLDLAAQGVKPGDTVTATVVDNTEFVRDPAIRALPAMTKVLTWTVGSDSLKAEGTPVEITQASPTDRITGSSEVLYVNTSHARDRAFEITWSVDGKPVAHKGHSLDLKQLELAAGSHEVTVSVTDPADDAAPAATQTWTVDNGAPTVSAKVTGPELAQSRAAGEPHYTVEEEFEMLLTSSDDQEGYVVTEFRLDGDGWHNYYGWPTDASAPFKFTPTGTNIDDLVYGNLGTGGMSLSPFQPREAGYGKHRVEYRAIDAAGNIGETGAFSVTVNPAGTSTETDANADSGTGGTADSGADGSGASSDVSGSTDAAGTANAAGAADGATASAAGDAKGEKPVASDKQDLASTGTNLWVPIAAGSAALVAAGALLMRRRKRAQ